MISPRYITLSVVEIQERHDDTVLELDGRPGSRNGAPGSVARSFATSLFEFLQYTPLEEEKPYTLNSTASLDEIGEKVPVELISEQVNQSPRKSFEYRPNPLFGGKSYKSRLGITRHHWSEGDGMFHTVYFDKSGDEFSLFYKNKDVETEAYLIENKEGRPVVLATAECSTSTLLVNIFLNQLRFGFLTRPTSNTAVWSHNGRVFAAAEGNLSYEIDISDLRTLGKFSCKGAWPLDNFIAHSKIDPVTNELIFQGMSMKKPYTLVGVISADGETLVHTVGVNNERQTMNHDILITERYTVVMGFPLLVDIGSTFRGKPVLNFDPSSFTRFGILPRFGDSDSIRWFEVKSSLCFTLSTLMTLATRWWYMDYDQDLHSLTLTSMPIREPGTREEYLCALLIKKVVIPCLMVRSCRTFMSGAFDLKSGMQMDSSSSHIRPELSLILPPEL
ncbi:hypothetical protein R1sor_024132 [Riccia sorocarpa]|uniref:Uncharacterized protein n=1 Tax=Riccia sorocarpa TaxID=122646 RepID=A0ABD3GTP4_9MARC